MSPQPEKRNKVRIIAGSLRGRQLHFPDAAGLRPTGNRIRETVFNWLMPVLPGSQCLDLFAGSGALGIEACSRGAAHVTAIEQNPLVYRELSQHITQFALQDRLQLLQADVLTTLPTLTKRYDIVFLDPPFAGNYWLSAGSLLLSSGIITPTTLIYTEAEEAHIFTEMAALGFEIVKQKRAGSITYGILRAQPANPS